MADDDPFVAAMALGFFAAAAVLFLGMGTAPADSGVWHGYAVVLAALVAGGAVVVLTARYLDPGDSTPR